MLAQAILPLLDHCHHCLDALGMRGIRRQVASVGRIVLQVEQLRSIDLRIADQLPWLISHRPLDMPLGEKHGIPHFLGFAAEDGHQGSTVQVGIG